MGRLCGGGNRHQGDRSWAGAMHCGRCGLLVPPVAACAACAASPPLSTRARPPARPPPAARSARARCRRPRAPRARAAARPRSRCRQSPRRPAPWPRALRGIGRGRPAGECWAGDAPGHTPIGGRQAPGAPAAGDGHLASTSSLAPPSRRLICRLTRLSGQHRLVQVALPLRHHAVGGHPRARQHLRQARSAAAAAGAGRTGTPTARGTGRGSTAGQPSHHGCLRTPANDSLKRPMKPMASLHCPTGSRPCLEQVSAVQQRGGHLALARLRPRCVALHQQRAGGRQLQQPPDRLARAALGLQGRVNRSKVCRLGILLERAPVPRREAPAKLKP